MYNDKLIRGKSVSEWERTFPIITSIREQKETLWINEDKQLYEVAIENCPLAMQDVQDASERLERFADYFQIAFPETKETNGIIESPLQVIPHMQKCLEETYGCSIPGTLWLKMDSHLPISGSIKARGGIYEVLAVAEDIAMRSGLLKAGDTYSVFDSQEFRNLFSQYSIAVGSTGNLGLSIGIISAKLGFKVTVHMSADARQWKKDMLRSKGVNVIEYESDYSVAVMRGREQAKSDPYCHFVDDENSKTLFMGYAVAGLRLKKQLGEAGITVDAEHPLYVYLPCGVGGGPGGVAFGLKLMFQDNVHCYFAEPTHSCCMMLGMATGLNHEISVQDLGVDNVTVADGLAVGRASGFVGNVMKPFISGCYSMDDERMYCMLAQLADTENIYLEPSALAGMHGPVLFGNEHAKATHVVWATGGGMVPKKEMEKYYENGKYQIARSIIC